MNYDKFVTHSIDFYMGKPKSGKTLIAGSYPKPLLYISVGNDGGGRVLLMKYKDDVDKGLIKVINLRNDPVIGGKIAKTSVEKLPIILKELRQPGADTFKTIVIDTLGSLQEDYKTYLEFTKGGKQLSQQEWGDIAKMMLSVRDTMKRFSEDMGVTFVWCTHTSEQELYETSGLNKELRIIPDLTIKTGIKFLKDASNIFYCCRKTIIDENGTKKVKFLTYVGPHPLMDTGTRDMYIEAGDFVENFTYDKWVKIKESGSLDTVNVLTVNNEQENNNNNESEEE